MKKKKKDDSDGDDVKAMNVTDDEKYQTHQKKLTLIKFKIIMGFPYLLARFSK
jgi:hypothetical protein